MVGVRAKPKRNSRPKLANVVPYKTVWLAFVDHSIVGAWPTKKRARAALDVLLSRSLLKLTFLIAGPYVLMERGQ